MQSIDPVIIVSYWPALHKFSKLATASFQNQGIDCSCKMLWTHQANQYTVRLNIHSIAFVSSWWCDYNRETGDSLWHRVHKHLIEN